MKMKEQKNLGLAVLASLAMAACGGDIGDMYGGGGGDWGVPSSSEEAWGGDGVEGGGEEGEGEAPAILPGQLTAGEWRDLDNWDFWVGLFEPVEGGELNQWPYFETRWGTHTRHRYPVRVELGEQPVVDAEVELHDAGQNVIWRARTDNRGRAELFDGFFGAANNGPFTIVARSGDGRTTVSDVSIPGAEVHVLELDSASQPAHTLDLMFMIDTTGSMGDELRYIQAELKDVITRAHAEAGQSLDVRVSVNFYRDHGDEYVVRPFPFTRDINQAISDLSRQTIDGGGDYPEAVDMAMENAIFEHSWSDEATARLMFIILDAPPHHTQASLDRLHRSVKAAAEKGVRIIPLMGSGYDRETEYLMRSFAIATGGTFTFLTDHSGIGDAHMEPTVGPYKVELLNDMLTRLIASYSMEL